MKSYFFFNRTQQLSNNLEFSERQLLSSPSMANMTIGPNSGGFVVEPALMEGSRPPSVTRNHLSLENISLSFRGGSHREDELL